MNISTVTTKGQATIPEEIRLLLQIQPGDKIFYQQADPVRKQYTAQVVSSKNAVDRLYGSLHRPGMKYVPIEVARKKAGALLGKKYGLKK